MDSLDALAIFGYAQEFREAVRWVSANVNFDQDVNVSVFETNIRYYPLNRETTALVILNKLPLKRGNVGSISLLCPLLSGVFV